MIGFSPPSGGGKPKSTPIRPILHFVEEAEKAIDGEALLEEALESKEFQIIY